MFSILDAICYEPIFLFFTFILSVISINEYGKNNSASIISVYTTFVAICLAFFIGFRPLNSIFADMWNYNYAWGVKLIRVLIGRSQILFLIIYLKEWLQQESVLISSFSY